MLGETEIKSLLAAFDDAIGKVERKNAEKLDAKTRALPTALCTWLKKNKGIIAEKNFDLSPSDIVANELALILDAENERIDEEFSSADLERSVDAFAEQIKSSVIEFGARVVGDHWEARYFKPGITWESDKLKGFFTAARMDPVVEGLAKVKNAYVTILKKK